MTAITRTDLDNAKQDVDHIAEVANSLEQRAVDRYGHSKLTVSGAIAEIATIVNRGNWAASTQYAIKDVVQNDGTWYICISGHTSSAAFVDDLETRWRIYQVSDIERCQSFAAADGPTWVLIGAVLEVTKVFVDGLFYRLANFSISGNSVTATFPLDGKKLIDICYK